MQKDLIKQQLYREQMKYGRKAARCAWKDKDTLSALMCYEQEYVAYKKLGLTDSAVYVIENAASLYDKYGYPSDAAISWSFQFLLTPWHHSFCYSLVATSGEGGMS